MWPLSQLIPNWVVICWAMCPVVAISVSQRDLNGLFHRLAFIDAQECDAGLLSIHGADLFLDLFLCHCYFPFLCVGVLTTTMCKTLDNRCVQDSYQSLLLGLLYTTVGRVVMVWAIFLARPMRRPIHPIPRADSMGTRDRVQVWTRFA